MIEWFSILLHIRITWGRFYISGHLIPKVSDLTGQGCGLEIRGLKSSLGDVKCICDRGERFWLGCVHDKSWGESGQNVVLIQWVWDRAWLCISNKLPGDTHTAGEDHTFQGTRSHESPSKHLLFKPGLRSSSCPVPAQTQVTQFTARNGIFVCALLFCFWISDSEASESHTKRLSRKAKPRNQNSEWRI